MKKILFGITGLTLGGAERVLVDIANNLCDKYDITIFTIYAKGELEKQLKPQVKLKSLYKEQYKNLPKFERKYIAPLRVLLFKNQIYKKYIKENYDVEVAFLEGPITRLFSVKNPDTKKIVWIHNDIAKVFGDGIKAKIKKTIDQKIYEKYEKLIFVSKDNLKSFEKTYNDTEMSKKDKHVIYNYIDLAEVQRKSEKGQAKELKKEKINFVEVARLVPQKAIDRIIKVHSRLIKECGKKQNFYIIGDGLEKEKLQKLIKKYNVEDTFFLLGKKENPYPYIKNADYFCLLSEFEGYGMVLEEAKILNKPIIITNTAAREAVENYSKSLILENNEQSIYLGLKDIIIGKTAIKNKIEKYDNQNILEEIEKILEE